MMANNAAGAWMMNIAQAMESRNGAKVAQLLDPKIQVKGKDKVDFDQNIQYQSIFACQQEFSQVIRILQHIQITAEQD